MLLHASRCESLTDDTARPADSAARAGVDVMLRYFDDTVHVFAILPFLPESADALAEFATFVSHHVG